MLGLLSGVLLALMLGAHGSAAGPAVPATMRAVQAAAPGCATPFACVRVVSVPTPTAGAGQVWCHVPRAARATTRVHWHSLARTTATGAVREWQIDAVQVGHNIDPDQQQSAAQPPPPTHAYRPHTNITHTYPPPPPPTPHRTPPLPVDLHIQSIRALPAGADSGQRQQLRGDRHGRGRHSALVPPRPAAAAWVHRRRHRCCCRPRRVQCRPLERS